MAEEVLGSGISKDVQQQLLLRETLIGEQYKSKEHLLFFNSNGAWIRLVSSINTQNEQQVEDFRKEVENFKEENTADKKLKRIQNLGSSLLASDNVLFGGMYPQGTTPGGGGLLEGRHTPLNIDSKGYISPSVAKLDSYHNYESLGYRPVPGIQSATVQSKNTYGTLREAEVKVVVWTLEDLEVMQALYLRPGYSILMEWGHSLGLSNDDSSINKDIRVNSDFFTRQSQSEIEKALLANRKSSDYNYDAMYGYISNFSWSFRPDGGYDCTVKIISKGAILESLAVTFDTTKKYPSSYVNSDDEEKTKEERRSVFHKFRAELAKIEPEIYKVNTRYSPNWISDTTTSDALFPLINGGLLKPTGKFFEKYLNDFRAFPIRTNSETVNSEGDTKSFERDTFYVTLGVILDIYNNFCTLEDTQGVAQKGKKSPGYGYTQFYTGWQDSILENIASLKEKNEIPYQKVSKLLTTDYHFSINPAICILPNQVGYDRNLKFFNDGCKEITFFELFGGVIQVDYAKLSIANLGSIQKSNFDINVQQAFKFNRNVRGEKDDVLNILVSLDHVITLLDQVLEEDKNSDQNTSNNMTVIMQRLLTDINDSLGGVNDLDVSYDEDENLFYVVDRRLTPKDPKTLPKVTFAGLNSTITDLSISSKISSNIASQISIAAQAGDTSTKDNVGPLLQWNKGLIDRHLVVKGVKKEKEEEPDSTDDTPKRTRLEKWLIEYNEVWRPFKLDVRYNGKWYEYAGGRDVVDYTELQNLTSLSEYHKEYCQKYVAEYYFKSKKDLPPPGTIPVELSFKTIGIAGLKIGQAFGFQRGILPQSYTDDYGFIITGLSHDISGNKWTTDVKALFFCAKPPPDYILKEYRTEIGLDCTPAEETAPVDTPPQEETTVEVVNTTDSNGETTTTTTTTTATPEDTEDLGISVEWWTLVAISYAENFPGNLQGYADVAQSLYNRAAAGYYGGSIVRNINAPGQYEPVFNNKQDWANIQDIDTAAVAVRNYKAYVESINGRRLPSSYTLDYYKQELKKCSDALQNSQLKQEAARFVGSRTEFLASTPESALAVGVAERQPSKRNNAFYWRYEGKDLFYNQGKLAATDFNRVTPPDNAVV